MSKLCNWFEVPYRTVYYRPTKAEPKLQERLLTPIKAMIEESLSCGYRTVAHLLDFNQNTVREIFQLKGWQVGKWPVGSGPESKPSRPWQNGRTSAGRRICADLGGT